MVLITERNTSEKLVKNIGHFQPKKNSHVQFKSTHFTYCSHKIIKVNKTIPVRHV